MPRSAIASRRSPACRCSGPIRSTSTGSVRMRTPSTSMSTVECPRNRIDGPLFMLAAYESGVPLTLTDERAPPRPQLLRDPVPPPSSLEREPGRDRAQDPRDLRGVGDRPRRDRVGDTGDQGPRAGVGHRRGAGARSAVRPRTTGADRAPVWVFGDLRRDRDARAPDSRIRPSLPPARRLSDRWALVRRARVTGVLAHRCVARRRTFDRRRRLVLRNAVPPARGAPPLRSGQRGAGCRRRPDRRPLRSGPAPRAPGGPYADARALDQWRNDPRRVAAASADADLGEPGGPASPSERRHPRFP